MTDIATPRSVPIASGDAATSLAAAGAAAAIVARMEASPLGTVFAGLGVISLLAALVTGLLAIESDRRVLEEVSP